MLERKTPGDRIVTELKNPALPPEFHDYLDRELAKLPPHSEEYRAGLEAYFTLLITGVSVLDLRNPFEPGSLRAEAFQLGAEQCRSLVKSSEHNDYKLQTILYEARSAQREAAAHKASLAMEWEKFTTQTKTVLKGFWPLQAQKELVREINSNLRSLESLPFDGEVAMRLRSEIEVSTERLLDLQTGHSSEHVAWFLREPWRTVLGVMYLALAGCSILVLQLVHFRWSGIGGGLIELALLVFTPKALRLAVQWQRWSLRKELRKWNTLRTQAVHSSQL